MEIVSILAYIAIGILVINVILAGFVVFFERRKQLGVASGTAVYSGVRVRYLYDIRQKQQTGKDVPGERGV